MMDARRVLAVLMLTMMGVGAACSSTPANDFEAGECTNDDLGGDIGEIETVDCGGEHAAEAFAQFDLEGDDFPGTDSVQQQGLEGCTASRFEDYVGIPYDSSIYLVQPITPSEETWDNGDRTVICVINGTTDGSALEGSAEGTQV